MAPMIKNMVLLVLMATSAVLGVTLRPTIIIADELPPIDLKAMVPTAFGDWREQLNLSAHIVNPQQEQMLEKIYSETLTRTYINSAGYRIMLSIAYGKNQSGDLQLHKPEVCYPAQGFAVKSKQPGALDLQGSATPATRLEASLGQRFEPVTYWSVVGDQVTASMTDKRLAEMRYAMSGRIPDGMLVRISSIDRVSSVAYAMHSQFASQMVQAIAPEHRTRFIGGPKIQATTSINP